MNYRARRRLASRAEHEAEIHRAALADEGEYGEWTLDHVEDAVDRAIVEDDEIRSLIETEVRLRTILDERGGDAMIAGSLRDAIDAVERAISTRTDQVRREATERTIESTHAAAPGGER